MFFLDRQVHFANHWASVVVQQGKPLPTVLPVGVPIASLPVLFLAVPSEKAAEMPRDLGPCASWEPGCGSGLLIRAQLWPLSPFGK